MPDHLIMSSRADFTTSWLAHNFAVELGKVGAYPLATVHVKVALVHLGRQLDLVVCPDNTPLGNGEKRYSEFLWDVSWWAEDSQETELVLAVESEWGRAQDVCFDFDKLLVAKAPWKLFITDAGHNGRSLNSFRNRIEQQIKRHVDYRTSETYVWIDHERLP